MSGSQVFHCACGARRPVSNGLRVVACVKCGRAMSPYNSDAFSIVPSRWMLAVATFISQLLGILAFLLAAIWMLDVGHRNGGVAAVALFGAVSVFAGGQAHRGSIGALGMCVVFDVAIGFACLIRPSIVTKFVYAPVAQTAPNIAGNLDVAMSIMTVVALLTAIVSMLAVPQSRRYLAWRRTQLTLAPPVW